jgi:hypothetical protein
MRASAKASFNIKNGRSRWARICSNSVQNMRVLTYRGCESDLFRTNFGVWDVDSHYFVRSTVHTDKQLFEYRRQVPITQSARKKFEYLAGF